MIDIENANTDVTTMFKDLSPMVLEIVNKYSNELDKIFDKLTNSASLTNEELRDFMLALSAESYLFGMSKDASLFKQECATTLAKEGQAMAYNAASGTQVLRNNQAIINTTDKQVVNLIYNAVANMMKTKLDEAHRMVNTLNSILISRNAEAKLINEKNEQEQNAKTRLLENYN